jgi:hypothetical protein
MKLRLTLLAVPFLALACSEAEQATLLEPPAISADVTIEAAPEIGDFEVEVRDPAAGCTNPLAALAGPPNTGTWTIDGGSANFCLRLLVKNPDTSPHTGGTLTYFQCRSKSGGGLAPKSDCDAGTARFVLSSKNDRNVFVDVGTSLRFFAMAAGITAGFRLKYTGKGSGLKNATIGPFDVSRPGFSAPTAVDDPGFSVREDATLTVGAPGLLNNDDLGNPQGAVFQFGAGDLGGSISDNVAGDTVIDAFGNGDLTVNADGSLTLTPTNQTGTNTFRYKLRNTQGESTAIVTITVTAAP